MRFGWKSSAVAAGVVCALIVAACTSFGTPPGTSTPDAGDAGAVDDGGDLDGGTPRDARALPGASDPGVVSCNPNAADPDNRECRTDSGAGCCYPPGDMPRCNRLCNNPWITCDEGADCPNGVCCGDPTMRTTCQPSCPGATVCKTSSDCPNMGSCEPYDCSGRIMGFCANSTALPLATQCKPLP